MISHISRDKIKMREAHEIRSSSILELKISYLVLTINLINFLYLQFQISLILVSSPNLRPSAQYIIHLELNYQHARHSTQVHSNHQRKDP